MGRILRVHVDWRAWDAETVEFDLSLMAVPLEDVSRRAGELAGLGSNGFFTAEGPHDVLGPLFLAAAGSPGTALMTNAAVAFPRNPIHLAHAAFDLQRLSRGRFRLGIAPQIPAHITRRFGIEWSRPVERMAGLVAALHAIFATWQDGTPLDHRGEFYEHTLMTPMFSPSPLEWGPPPVIVGALGPAMTEMAATVADGISVLPFNSEALLRSNTAPLIERGLEKSRRSRSSLEVVCGAIVGVGTTDAELSTADAGVRALLGFYGSTPAYRRVLESVGREDLHEPLRQKVREGDFAGLAELIDTDLVNQLAILGEPAAVAREINRRFGWLADRISLFTPSDPSDETLAALFSELRRAGTD